MKNTEVTAQKSGSTSVTRFWLKKVLKWVIIIELTYVVVLNALFALPLTQTLVNKIKPEKFQVTWDHAWTAYPFRVHIHGGFASGQARSQQWQFSATKVSASITLSALVFHRVWIRNIKGVDIDYRQRPRMKPDKDLSASLPYFPDIRGWPVNDAVTTPKKKKKPWFVSLKGINVSGDHYLWLYQFKGGFGAEIEADLKVRSQSGPLEMQISNLELDLDTIYANGTQEVLHSGTIQGTAGFAEFIPKQNKGLSMLEYLLADLTVAMDMENLSFINLFLLNFEGVAVKGVGQVQGRVVFDQGMVMPGTGLHVDARNLHVKVAALEIEGNGSIDVTMDRNTGNELDLEFQFSELTVIHEDDKEPLLSGQSLDVVLGGDGRLVKKTDKTNLTRTLEVTIEELVVPDLALYERFLPEKWPFKLYGGNGLLKGRGYIRPGSVLVDFHLLSENADMGIRQYRFDTDLDATLKIDNQDIQGGPSSISGTYVHLNNARLNREGLEDPEPWHASIDITNGQLGLFKSSTRYSEDHAMDLLLLLGAAKTSDLLSEAAGLMNFEARVSSLAWLGVLMGKDNPASVSGNGVLKGDIMLKQGWPDVGTNVEVSSENFAINVLDYISTGDGGITLKIQEGGENPDWLVDMFLKDGAMRRSDETEAGIEDVYMTLSMLVEDVSLEEEDSPFMLEFKIPSAKIVDMSVFNGYLPQEAALRFGGGSAELTADIDLQRDDADGWLKLKSSGVTANLDDQSLIGDLDIEILLNDGRPGDMQFDISGSTVRLNEVRVVGEETSFDEEHWSAEFKLTEAQTTFKKPLKLDTKAELQMSDSRPFVAMFRNNGGPKWLSNMLTVEDISGHAELHMADETLVLTFAEMLSDNIEVGAKGVLTRENTNAMYFMRYKKLSLLMKVLDGKRNIDIFGARKKYTEFQVDKALYDATVANPAEESP